MLLALLLLASGPGAPSKAPSSPDADRVYRLARIDLAKRLGIEERKVRKLSVAPRTWPDASLGCPKPDTMYAQVETPGYLIELEAAGKKFAYHSDRKRVVFCESG